MTSKIPFVASLAVVLLTSFSGGAVAAGGKHAEGKAGAAGPGVRVIAPKGTYEDHPSPLGVDPMSILLGGAEAPKSFYDLCDAVDAARQDSAVKHLFLDLSSPDLSLNLAQTEELANRVGRFRSSGKQVFAWIENTGTIPYAIASSADTILMADGAILDLPSLGLSTLYFGKAMELAGIRSSVVRVGDFKGAVEPFMLPEMSPHLREHYRAMLETMNDALVTRIANGRELDPTRVRRFQADRFFTSRAAADAGLVDEVVALGGAHARVEAQLGGRVSWIEGKKKDAEPTSFFEIMNQMFGGEADSSEEEPVVAVLHLAGMIVDGADEEPATLVSGPTVRAIEEIREDRNVRGVVVRVNSPGGSATASEAIRSALARLAAEKPVVVSMGEVAGSGGYWITCFGRPVFAEPATITGSIGVLALKLDAGLLLDRIGVRWDSVALDESATAFAPNRAWTKAESERLQGYCDEVYSKFVALVAASRKLDAAKVDSIGGGRVWSGVQAKENGLVDAVGGLEDALAALRKEASIPETVPVVHRPKPLSIFEVLEKVFGGGEEEVLLRAAAPLEALRAAGFDLRAPMRLALEGLRAPGPRVLLLEPTSFVIR